MPANWPNVPGTLWSESRSERALAEDVALFVEHAGQLPAAVRKGLDAENPLGTVPKALMKTGLAADPGEPSCHACGRLMVELNMLSVNDELDFLSRMLGVDPGEAAAVHMAMLDRYGGSGMDWYAAMVRMGAARGAARERDARADAESSLAVLEFPMLLGDRGEKDRQLKLMRETAFRLQPKKTFLGELAIRLAADIENPGQLSPARVERLVSEKNRESRIMFEYFLGWRLVQAGHREAGRAHLARAAIKPMHNPLLALLARVRLTELDANAKLP
jgi:hypothetical protein